MKPLYKLALAILFLIAFLFIGYLMFPKQKPLPDLTERITATQKQILEQSNKPLIDPSIYDEYCGKC